MLERVIEHHDRATKTLLGNASRKVAVRGNEHHHTGQRSRQHLRFIT
jgi:hypothetical protein